MEDSASKVKQLSESLQNQQASIIKKKESIEAINKNTVALEKEVYELRQKFAHSEAEKELKKDALNKNKEALKKNIEQAKRILNSDKAALQTEKEGLQAKVEKATSENKTLLNEKNELLKTHKGSYQPKEVSKITLEEERKIEEGQTFESLTKDVDVQKDKVTGFLTVETLTKVIDINIILAGKKFRETVQENRRKLRSLKNLDLKAFIDHTGKEVSQHTEVYKDIENQVLKTLGIEKNIFEKSIEYYMSVGNMDVLALMNLLGEKLKSYLKATKEISKDTFKDIMKAKTEFIQKYAKEIYGEDNRRYIVQTQMATVSGTFQQKEAMSVNTLRSYFEFKLNNYIYEKFGVEDEDVKEAMSKPEIQYDMEITEFLIKSEEALYESRPQIAQPGAK
jgi:hypothetical protein